MLLLLAKWFLVVLLLLRKPRVSGSFFLEIVPLSSRRL